MRVRQFVRFLARLRCSHSDIGKGHIRTGGIDVPRYVGSCPEMCPRLGWVSMVGDGQTWEAKRRKSLTVSGFWSTMGNVGRDSGARDRTRTGKPLGGGFSSHCVFRRRNCSRPLHHRSCAGLCLRHRGAHPLSMCRVALGAPRLVSTPSTARVGRHAQGLARRCLGHRAPDERDAAQQGFRRI